MAPRRRSEIMIDVRELIARRLERKLSREGAWKERMGFPIVAYPATRLPADRKEVLGTEIPTAFPDLSAGRNSGEGAN